MIALILAASIALAEEPQIISVAPGETITPSYQSYLLPELHYDSFLTKGLNLGVCKKGLNSCQEISLIALDEARSSIDLMQAALDAVQGQMDSDGHMIQDITDRNIQLHQDVQDLEVEVLIARGQRNTAWAVTSGLVVATVATGAIIYSSR